MNVVILQGRVGADPEVKETPNSRVANFSLATNEVYKDKEGNKVENTEWHRLVAWGPTAGILEKYVKKGDLLTIEGKLAHRSYEDQEGVTKYITEVVVNRLHLNQQKKDS